MNRAEQLLAGLQQTGLAGNVSIWLVPGDSLPDGSEAIFFLSMLRLKTWVSSSGPPESCDRILATERPTVPKPTSAIFRRRSAPADFFAARGRAVFVFCGRDAARDLPKCGSSGQTSYQRRAEARRRKAV